MIIEYIKKIEETIFSFNEIISDTTNSVKIYNYTQGLISGKIEFINKYELHYTELINTQKQSKLKYKYHLMNDLNEMIFRYDNSKHHPEIKTFPHHKHIFKCILEAKEPEMIDILIEIFEIIKEN